MDPERLFKQEIGAPLRRRTLLVSLAVAAASFLVVAWSLQGGLEAIGRRPRSRAFEGRWQEFLSMADECDVLLVGTSRVERQLDPAAFDEALGRQGLGRQRLAVRSFNFGLPRMSILEAEELVERLAARRPRRLKLVLIEPTFYVFDLENWTNERELATHDWRRTRAAIRQTLAAERRHGASWSDRLRYALPHLLSFGCRTVNLGQAAPLVFPPLADAGEAIAETASSAGYRPLPVERDERAAWRERFRKFLALPSPPDWNGAPLAEEELAYYRRLLAGVRRAGAEPVLLAAPRVKRDSHMVAVLESRRAHFAETPLIDYLRGRSDESLYVLDLWHDFDHLNADGARLLSRLVARDLAPLLAAAAAEHVALELKEHH